MFTAHKTLIIAMSVCYVMDVCLGYHSCKDLKLHNPNVPSGEYQMYNGNGETYTAYCEFRDTYGYMFISKCTDVPIDIAKIAPSTSSVLVRHRRQDGLQKDTKMEQIPAYSNIPLSIQYNQNVNYAAPLNRNSWAPFLYLGFLPKQTANQKSSQGYRAEGQDFAFSNCDANPNSYLAFFFNRYNGSPNGYYQNCCYSTLMKNWIDVGTAAFTNLPDKYFFQFEMHMGGCGGYAINGYKTLTTITGAALGMRFEL